MLLLGPVGQGACDAMLDDLTLRLKAPLESRFTRAGLDAVGPVAGIVVLGGGLSRVEEAVRIAQRFGSARIVLTGASQKEETVLRAGGIAPQRLVIEPMASNTFENAVFSYRMARPRPQERWLLVTSTLHMPRAMGVFRAIGFQVDAWPVHDTPAQSGRVIAHVRHEVMGLVAYRALGRTSELFPRPRQSIRATDAHARMDQLDGSTGILR